ncbi:binder of sperm protein homolog 1 isoform X2 [Ochotona princeps]|uniref:binder of sperm protein homolog 1 isoform X2 n=1 Tax=Ochotona princeps TaxID=9978 RepID=UPI00271516A1|nr:binder of sperm protein homolog 1 isoform X2 [Ochotona princeps]
MAWPAGILLACCLWLREAGFASSIGGRCVFPFRYQGQVFHDCTQLNARHKWCSLNQSYTGYWKYCTTADFAKCVFPFWFRRMIYWECTDDGNDFGKKWCSLTQDFNRDQIWKFC